MASVTLDDLNGLQTLAFGLNYDQIKLGLIYNGVGGDIVGDNIHLHYKNMIEDEITDYSECYIQFNIKNYHDRWLNASEEFYKNNYFKYGISQRQIDGLNDEEGITKAVLYYNWGDDDECHIEVERIEDETATGNSYYSLKDVSLSHFRMAYIQNGTVFYTELSEQVEFNSLKDTNARKENGDMVNGVPYEVVDGYPTYGFPWMRGSSSPCVVNGYWGNTLQETTIETNMKVFRTKADATRYLKTGLDTSIEGEEEGGEEPGEEVESGTYFYDCYNEYYSDLALTNHIASTTQKYRITFEDFPKGTTPVFAKVNNEKYINNVQFMVHDGYGQYITSASSKIGNIEVPITENILSTFMRIRTNYGIIYDSANDRYCKTTVYTNMPIIGVDGNAVPGRIPVSDDMIGNENGADYDCGLSECWLLDTENVTKLSSIFNTTIDRSSPGASELVLAEWVQGLSCYSNPLDVVCDLFYMPINVNDYITGSSKAFTLQPSING